MLIIFSGLPGAGKTSIARELASQVGAVYLRIDSIEQALRESGMVQEPMNDAGYRAAYAVAADNLRLGRVVVADSVNPWKITRDAWTAVAKSVGSPFVEIEVKCSDAREHRSRVEGRVTDIPGLELPTWEHVTAREYHEWDRPHIIVDTAGCDVSTCVQQIRSELVAKGIA